MHRLNRAMGHDDHSSATAAAAGRRHAILQRVADALHSRNGAASIDAVLATTATSREDIAREFGSADALLVAVTATIARDMLAPLREQPTPGPFKARLVDFSRRATNEYFGLRLKNLYRMAVTDAAGGGTAIRRELYRQGPGQMQHELARFLLSAREAGVHLDGDCHRLASCYVALLRSYWDLSEISVERSPTDGDLDRLVEMFFTGVQGETVDA